MKKILIVNQWHSIGGVETVLLNYLKILPSLKDYHFDVVYLEGRGIDQIEYDKTNINVIGILSPIETEFRKFIHASHPNDYLTSWKHEIFRCEQRRLLDLINHNAYDLIFSFHLGFDAFLGRYDMGSWIPVVRWIHAGDFGIYRQMPKDTEIIFNKYQHFISISQDMTPLLADFLAEINVNDKSIHLLHNPVVLDDIRQKANEANNDPYLNDDFIVQVARLDEHAKNHLGMIDIFAQLKAKGIKEKLYIIGDGPSRQQLQDKITALGLENDCLLLGAKSNPFPYMKAAKLFIHTANFEGLPTVLIESMTCGTPVVAFDCPTGPKDILANGKYGSLIPMGNNEQFVETVYELLVDEDKRQAYIEKLPEAVERFGLEKIGQEFKKLLDELTQGKTA